MFSSTTFDILLQRDVMLLFLRGLGVTLELFAWSAVSAFLLGALLASLHFTGSLPSRLVQVFVGYHRNVPAIVQFMVWYFGIPQLFPQSWTGWTDEHLSGFFFAVVALTLNAAAYISEDLRSGFRAVPHGQYEAARALGLSYVTTLRRVLMPQAVRAALPALLNQAISLFKATSLAMAIGVAELMYIARQVDGATYATFASYLVPTVLYLACTLSLMAGGGWLQNRLAAR